MQLKEIEIEIENYKCFRHPTRLKLEKGINILVGQNNVGKTSILEVLGLNFNSFQFGLPL